ncbi:hypothetical protein [Marinobacter subterrani]|uniref:hypothetical protein n=1 Tax=Marinobacter subterrani TaxID=1658765 RepID=UPI0023558FFD|nr:hypothetical protein [Marinobacter subterrani]
MWNLKCYYSPGGDKSKAQETYNRGSDELKAAFDVEAEYLLKSPKDDWKRPHAAKLSKGKKGDFKEYYEIRFFADNTQQRPIGYFGPGENDFTILIWATEKGNQLKPVTWRDRADNARENIEREASYAKPFIDDE